MEGGMADTEGGLNVGTKATALGLRADVPAAVLGRDVSCEGGLSGRGLCLCCCHPRC